MRITARILVLAAALLVAGCPPVRPPAAGLDRTVEAYFDEMLALNPTYATDIDDHRFDDRLEITPSPLYESQSLALERRYLDIVRAIDPGTLDDEERLTREMFIYNREREIESLGFPGRLLPIDQFDGGLAMELPSYGDGTGSQPFETPDDYERWIRRAPGIPALGGCGDRRDARGHGARRRAPAHRHGESRAAARGPARGRSREERLLRPDRAHARRLAGRRACAAEKRVRRS